MGEQSVEVKADAGLWSCPQAAASRGRVCRNVWHVFFDLAFGLSLDEADRLVQEGLVEPTRQIFQAPGGATTEKVIFKYPYLYAYEVAETVTEPTLVGKYVEDKNGHVLPYVHFQGGRLRLLPQALQMLDDLAGSGSR